MRATTVKLSKPNRLKIKKKLLFLMNIPFELTQHSSPSRIQYSKCQINSGYVVPYPHQYWTQYLARRYPVSESFGILRISLARSHTWTDYPNIYRDSCLVPTSQKKYELSDDPIDHWYIGETEYIKRGESILIRIELTRNRGFGVWNNSIREIRVRYGIKSKRLNITSNLRSEYNTDVILEIINSVLFGLFVN